MGLGPPATRQPDPAATRAAATRGSNPAITRNNPATRQPDRPDHL